MQNDELAPLLSGWSAVLIVAGAAGWAWVLARFIHRLVTRITVAHPEYGGRRVTHPAVRLPSGGRWVVWPVFHRHVSDRVLAIRKARWGRAGSPVDATIEELNLYARKVGLSELPLDLPVGPLSPAELVVAAEAERKARVDDLCLEQKAEEVLATLQASYRRELWTFLGYRLPLTLLPFLLGATAATLCVTHAFRGRLHDAGGGLLPVWAAVIVMAVVGALPFLDVPRRPTLGDAAMEVVGKQYRESLSAKGEGDTQEGEREI